MKPGYILAVILAIGASVSGHAQQTKLLTAEKHNDYGLIYTLPLTAFQVEVTIVKEQKVAGPFSKYSKIFTSDANIISNDEVNYTIESVNVFPYGVPDADNRYLMQLKAGAPAYIQVADDGMLLAINKETEYDPYEQSEITEIIGAPVNGKEYLEFVNEDFIAAQSSYKKAQLLAEEIMEVRDAKVSLTRGTAETMPTDGRQLEIMLESLEKQEKALTNAFTGASWKEKVVKTFSVVPEGEGRMVVCRLDKAKGLVSPEARNAEALYFTVKATREAELPVDAKGEEKKVPKDAVMYCIPGYAQISVSFGNSSLYSKEFAMSQFGMLFGLNPSIFTDKKEPSFAIFDPSTGALEELGTLKP